MNKFTLLLCGIIGSTSCHALSGPEYMERFNTYRSLSQNIPVKPTPQFLEFIEGSAPLSKKLREKWLYELARNKDWVNYHQYYQPSNDINLICYEQIAQYNSGDQKQALNASIPLWLTGSSQPPACNNLFELLMKDDNFNQNLITQRIALALDKRNIQLARYLLKQYKTPHPAEVQALNRALA